MAAAGGEPILAATLDGSCESVAWSSDGARLLVLAADPGSYGLDWSARAVTGAKPAPDPIVRRPGDARRRLYLIDLATGAATEVGPPDLSVWEIAWDGDDTIVALVSSDHTGSGWYQAKVARLDLTARTAATLYEPAWQLEGLELAPDGVRVAVVEGYASDHGLLSGSVRIVDLASGGATDPWPDLQTVGLASWADADSLWYARTDGTGNACGRIWLDGRREERWRDEAFIGDAITTPACAITSDAADIWTTHQAHGVRAGAGEVRSHDGYLDAPDVVQRPHRRGPRLPGRPRCPLDGRGRRRDRRGVDDAHGRRRAASRRSCACTAVRPGTGGRTSRTPNRTRCCSRRPAMRVCSRTPAAASAEATPSRRR